MDTNELKKLAAQFLDGEMSAHAFHKHVGGGGIDDLGDTQLDLDRHRRCGFPEVIYAEGKTVDTLENIFQSLVKHGVDVLATRMSPEKAAQLETIFPAGRYNTSGRTFRIPLAGSSDEPRHSGKVVIVTAGTSDLPVAEEARETVLWSGACLEMIQDVGVAGPHRLTANLATMQDADVVIVVAGMEGALPSVVGGHVGCPVIAVPTSVGYGASFGGVAALLGMLNSCSSNVTVVNIDAGFKGGYLAGLIASNIAKAKGSG